jgi:tetratricopeptide (TPR) repeat protein
MRRIALVPGLALGFALAAGSFGLVAATPGTAEACGMYRPKVAQSTERLVAQAAEAERKGELRTATRLYERAMNDDAGATAPRVRAALKAGELQAKAGKGRESLRRFEKAVALDSTHYEARMVFGRALAAKGDFAAAQAQFGAATGLPRATPMERGHAQAALAVSLAKQGRAHEARQALDRARELGALSEALAEAEAALGPAATPPADAPAALAVQM